MIQSLLGEVLGGRHESGGVMDAAESVTTLSPEPDDRKQLRRAIIASTVGTIIEWYDFFLYSTVTGLVFGQLYFPKSDPAVGTLQAFGIYAVGFVARPGRDISQEYDHTRS